MECFKLQKDAKAPYSTNFIKVVCMIFQLKQYTALCHIQALLTNNPESMNKLFLISRTCSDRFKNKSFMPVLCI